MGVLMPNIKIDFNSKLVRTLLFAGTVLVLCLFQWRTYYSTPTFGLDPSWKISLGMMTDSDTLFFGKDYAFTYGPAYFLMKGFVKSSSILFNIISAVGLNLLFHTIRVFLMSKIAFGIPADTKAAKAAKLAALVLLFSAANQTLFCDCVATLAFFWLYDIMLLLRDNAFTRRDFLCKVLPCTVMLGILPLVKFSYGAVAVFVVLSLCGVLLAGKCFAMAIGSLLVFPAAVCAYWVLLGQKLRYIGLYFKYGLEQASGYSETMAGGLQTDSGAILYLPLLLFGIAFCASCALGLLWVFRNDKRKAFALFVGVSLLFLTWKEAFVRFDEGHALSFCGAAVFSVVYIIYVIHKENLKIQKPLPKKLRLLPAAVLTVFLAVQVVVNGIYFCSYKTFVTEAWHILNSEHSYAGTKSALLNYHEWFEPLNEKISSTDTVDVFPIELSLIYAYDLNYNPRLSVQSYSDYTAALDSATAEGFSGAHAPDKLVYRYDGKVDARYVPFDEPLTFRTILNNYTVIDSIADQAALLEHTADSVLQEEVISSLTAAIGENIPVPQSDLGNVYMRIAQDITLLGKLANFVYKMPQDYITITTTDGEEHTYPFIRRVAANGLYVSSFAKDADGLHGILTGEAAADIASIRIDSSALFYDKEFGVTFFTEKG